MNNIETMSLDDLTLFIGDLDERQRMKIIAALAQVFAHEASILTYRMDEATSDEFDGLVRSHTDLISVGVNLDNVACLLFRKANREGLLVAA